MILYNAHFDVLNNEASLNNATLINNDADNVADADAADTAWL